MAQYHDEHENLLASAAPAGTAEPVATDLVERPEPVAWRYKNHHPTAGWHLWSSRESPDAEGRETFQCEPLYSAAAIADLTRARDEAIRERDEARLSSVEWAELAGRQQARAEALASSLAEARKVIERVLPTLDENARWHRDMQSEPGRVSEAFEAAAVARAFLNPTEGKP